MVLLIPVWRHYIFIFLWEPGGFARDHVCLTPDLLRPNRFACNIPYAGPSPSVLSSRTNVRDLLPSPQYSGDLSFQSRWQNILYFMPYKNNLSSRTNVRDLLPSPQYSGDLSFQSRWQNILYFMPYKNNLSFRTNVRNLLNAALTLGDLSRWSRWPVIFIGSRNDSNHICRTAWAFPLHTVG